MEKQMLPCCWTVRSGICPLGKAVVIEGYGGGVDGGSREGFPGF